MRRQWIFFSLVIGIVFFFFSWILYKEADDAPQKVVTKSENGLYVDNPGYHGDDVADVAKNVDETRM